MKSLDTAIYTLLLFVTAAALPPARAQNAVDRIYMQAHAADEAGNYDLAVDLWSEALKLNPKDEVAWYNRGCVYYNRHLETEKAVADFTEAIRLDPKDADGWKMRGESYAYEGEKEKAAADFTEAIHLDPADAGVYFNRAEMYSAKSATAGKAIADYGEAIRLRATLEAFQRRGEVYAAMGETDKAVADFSEVIKGRKVDAPRENYDLQRAYCNRAHVFRDTGENDNALADYTMADQIEMKDVTDGIGGRGEVYAAMGQMDKAVADFTEAIGRGSCAAAYRTRGMAYYVSGDFDKAIADFNDAIGRFAPYSEAYASRGAAYEAKGDNAKAQADFKLALDLAAQACARSKWEEWKDIAALANAEALAGKFDDATKHAQQAIDLAGASDAGKRAVKMLEARLALYKQRKTVENPFKVEGLVWPEI